MQPIESSGIGYYDRVYYAWLGLCWLLWSRRACAIFVEEDHLHMQPLWVVQLSDGFTLAAWQGLFWREDRVLLCADCRHLLDASIFFVGGLMGTAAC